MRNRNTSRRQAVLVHDGQAWFLFCRDGSAASLRGQQPGPADRIPGDLLEAAAAGGAARVRFLLAGEVRRLETALPPGLRFDDVSALLANEIAEQSGSYGNDLLCAGAASDVLGAKGGTVLAGCFERALLQNLRGQLAEAGLDFDGVAALELACLAHWRATHGDRAETLMIVGQAHIFIAPERQLADSHGPLSVSGGVRHIKSDPDGWGARFQRGTRFLEKAKGVHLLAMADPQDGIGGVVGRTAALSPLHALEREAVYEGAAHAAAAARANSLKAAVPVANPYIPRKRFSHAWIALPCLLILALPPLYLLLTNQRLKAGTEKYNTEAAQFLPLEKKVKDADKKKKDLQAGYQSELSVQNQLANRRKPLAAFIHMTYFFSKHAGNTLLLDTVSDAGNVIFIRGVYTDPEDGLALNDDLTRFTADKGLRVAENKVSEDRDAEGVARLRLELSVDYANMRK
jgi:hypothetical protein